jgi:hypothetical protein
VAPGFHPVVGFVQPAVVAEQDVVAIRGVEDDVVVIDVHAGHGDLDPRLAAVGAAVDVGLQRPDRVRIVAVDEDLVVVAGIAAAVPVVGRRAAAAAASCRRIALADPRPAPTGIVGTEEAAFAALRGHERVDRPWIAPVDADADAPDLD